MIQTHDELPHTAAQPHRMKQLEDVQMRSCFLLMLDKEQQDECHPVHVGQSGDPLYVLPALVHTLHNQFISLPLLRCKH